jgi:hypothetical protein
MLTSNSRVSLSSQFNLLSICWVSLLTLFSSHPSVVNAKILAERLNVVLPKLIPEGICKRS